MLMFARAHFLWLLLLVPVILLGYALLRRARRRRVRRFGEEALVDALMPSWSGAKGWWRTVLFCLGFACFAVGLARPMLGAKLVERETKGAEIMICLDVSNSMLAQDYTPDRLSRAKLAISRIVDRLDGDRIGLIIFAGSSFVQLPITTDYVSAKMFLNSIDTQSVPVQGTAIGEALQTAAKSFSVQSEKSRAIIVITDGENHEDDAVDIARQVAETGIRIYTIGVGSPQGQPIPTGQKEHRHVLLLPGLFCPAYREFIHGAPLPGQAEIPHGAGTAPGLPVGRTYRGAQLHHGLGKGPGLLRIHLRQQGGEAPLHLGIIGAAVIVQQPAHHPQDISVHRGGFSVKTDGADGARSVVPNARQRPYGGVISWKYAAIG